MEKEPRHHFIKPEKELKKIDLETKFMGILKMKIDTQEEINSLEKKLEQTERTMEALEAEEREVKKQLDELKSGAGG